MTRQTRILDCLRHGETLLCDGAMGTMLQQHHLPVGIMPEQWNDERPDVILGIHQAYIAAGSQIVTSNTFGGNRVRLQEAGLAARAVELSQKGVAIAREAADDRAWVAASVGPTGKILEPYGDLPLIEAEDLFAEQIVALAEAGADLILAETQHDIEEACCIVRMAKKHTSLPVFCTFAFNQRGRTMMGLHPAEAAQRIEAAGGDVVGANCGEGPQAIIAALEQMRPATALPLMAQSNAGIPRLGAEGQSSWDITPEQMADKASVFAALGARVLGGCCGSGPAHIAAIAAWLTRAR